MKGGVTGQDTTTCRQTGHLGSVGMHIFALGGEELSLVIQALAGHNHMNYTGLT